MDHHSKLVLYILITRMPRNSHEHELLIGGGCAVIRLTVGVEVALCERDFIASLLTKNLGNLTEVIYSYLTGILGKITQPTVLLKH